MTGQTSGLSIEEWVKLRLSNASENAREIVENGASADELISLFSEEQLDAVNRILAYAEALHAIEKGDLRVKLYLAEAKLALARQLMGPKAIQLFDLVGKGTLKPWWGEGAERLSGEERADVLLKSLQSLAPLEAKDLD